MSDGALEALAKQFAGDLTATLWAFAGEDCAPFKAFASTRPDRKRFSVEQDPAEGILLCRDLQPIMRLEASYSCELDRSGTYLRVNKSTIALHRVDASATVPYFHYDFEEKHGGDLPRAHLQVHDDPGRTST